MDAPISNDNGDAIIDENRLGPDGEAALLLVESLLHGLIARGVLSVADAVEIVDIAAEVKTEFAGEPFAAPAEASISRLNAIAVSLRHDQPSERSNAAAETVARIDPG